MSDTSPEAVPASPFEQHSEPLVAFMGLVPTSVTTSYEDLKEMEEKAKVVLSAKLDALEKHLTDALTELNQREEKVIATGRSVFDFCLGLIKRSKAQLAGN